jgi:hypothetical protein
VGLPETFGLPSSWDCSATIISSELTVAWRLEDEGVNPLRLNTGQTRRSQVAFVSDGQNRAPRPGMACNAEIPSPAASFDQVTTND